MLQKLFILIVLLFTLCFSCESGKKSSSRKKFVGSINGTPTGGVGTENETSNNDGKISISPEDSGSLDSENPFFKILGLGTAQAQEKEAAGELECPTGQVLYGITAAGKLLCRTISVETPKISGLRCVKTTKTATISGRNCYSYAYGGDFCTGNNSLSSWSKTTVDASATVDITNGSKCAADYYLVDCSSNPNPDSNSCTVTINSDLNSYASGTSIGVSTICCKIVQ